MAHCHAVQKEGRLLVVVFEGVVTPEEEHNALLEIGADPEVDPRADILVDRARASMTVGAEDVEPQLELADGIFATEKRPHLALVVSRDYDYDMCQLLAQRSRYEAPHEVKVFRSLDAACEWLGVDSRSIEWPAHPDPPTR